MKTVNRFKIIGSTAALAVLIAIGVKSHLFADNKPPSESDLRPGPIDPAVTGPAEQLGRALAMVAAHVRPAVVSVYSEKIIKMQSPGETPFGDDFFRQFFGNQFHSPRNQTPRELRVPQRGMGSGMILDRQGHILTNYHVVQDVDEIKIRLANKHEFEAEVVGTDPKSDVAIIKIKGPVPDDLPIVDLGDSDALQVGSLVMAVGAPFGLTQTVTEGIISATGRSDVGIADYEDFLQTDAPINPGNSGGPLVNMRGEVIGMNSAIATDIGQFAGVGFAIPVNMIKTILPTLIKGGTITRGLLGVVIQEVTPELAAQFHLPDDSGALIAQVNDDSPAGKAGIKVGDVIVRYNDIKIASSRDLRNLVAATLPGATAKVTLLRNGTRKTVDVTIGSQPSEPLASAQQPASENNDQLSKLGLTVQNLTPDLAQQFNLTATKGIVITQVIEGSPASQANLQAGDLIVEADHQPVATVDELQNTLAKSKDSVLFLIKRKDASVFVVMRLG